MMIRNAESSRSPHYGMLHLPNPDMSNPNLADLFETHFEVVPADQDHMLEQVFRIRHQVYCEELGFEPSRENQLEQDEFDKNAIHCLLRHKRSQTYVGCVRLVLSDSHAPDVGFPFEHVCGESVRWSFDHAIGKGRKQYGEISRLAITAAFRRPRNFVAPPEGAHPALDARDEEARQLFPSIAVGLYLAVAAMSLNKGLDGVFAMMEPRLARQLSRFGFKCQTAGDAVEHRGTRVPYFISCHTLMDTLKSECQTLLRKIQGCMAMPYAPYA